MDSGVIGSYGHASLAVQHFLYAGLLSLLFAVVTAIYLLAMWRVAGTLDRITALLAHTLFLLWQSNVAFVAVVCLAVAVHNLDLAGEPMRYWHAAPLMVPASAALYASVLALALGLVWRRGRAARVSDREGPGA